jgi:ribokinase
MGHDSAPTAFFIGDVALDEYYAADRWPGLGDKVMVDTKQAFCGGMIANAASVHAALGGATEFISLLNTGEVTRRLLDDLTSCGVQVTHMLYDPQMPDSKTIIVLVRNEHAVLIPELGDAPMVLPGTTFRALCSDGMLYTTLGRIKRLRAVDRDALGVLHALHASGRSLVFDLNVDGFGEEDLPYLRQAYVVIMNEQGFRRSFGNPEDGSVARWLDENEIAMLVITRGPNGVSAFTSTGRIDVGGIPVDVVDVTGAGDTFGAALTFALGRNAELRRALAFANSAAAYAVTQMGPRGGMTSVQMVLDFMERHGVPDPDVIHEKQGK